MSGFIELLTPGGGVAFLAVADIVGIRVPGDADVMAEPKHPIHVMMRGSPREVPVFGLSANDLLFKLWVARAEYLDMKDRGMRDEDGRPFVFKTYYLDGHAP